MTLRDFARPSSRYLAALLLTSALCLANCSPTKKATTASQQTTNSSERQTASERKVVTDGAAAVSLQDVLHGQTDTSTITEQASGEEVVTTERVYDTDKPVDPATGTPPLKRETTQTRRKADAGWQTQTISQSVDRQLSATGQAAERQVDNIASQESSRHSGDTTTQVETVERRGLNGLQKTLCIVGALALLAGVVWLILKLKRILQL